MGYRSHSSGPSVFTKTCGWLWWKKSCAWIETGMTTGNYDDWVADYPFGEYPRNQFKCTTCDKTIWW